MRYLFRSCLRIRGNGCMRLWCFTTFGHPSPGALASSGWALMDSNHRSLAYQTSALTNYAKCPCPAEDFHLKSPFVQGGALIVELQDVLQGRCVALTRESRDGQAGGANSNLPSDAGTGLEPVTYGL